jgi:hypothetical protein
MPITANIIQTMKHTVNAKVLAVTTDHALYCCEGIVRSFQYLRTKIPAARRANHSPDG